MLEDMTMNEIFQCVGAPTPHAGQSETSPDVEKELARLPLRNSDAE